MSDTYNNYQSPTTEIKTVDPLVSGDGLSATMLKYLNDASPWMRFIGIVGFIGSGFLAIIALVSLMAGPVMSSALMSEIGVYGFETAITMGFGLLYLVMAAVAFFPAFFTFMFGLKIRNYFRTNSIAELELAFKNNKSLWKFNGIMTIIALAMVPLTIIIAIVVALSAMF